MFGGTWKQIKDRFLLCAGDTYKNGSTGGEVKHTLTVSEMPKTALRLPHVAYYNSYKSTGYTETRESFSYEGATTNIENSGWHILSTGNNESHNNMPPYLTVYVWERTA